MDRQSRHPRKRAIANAAALPQSGAATSKAINRFQDAVYREMYRLEAQKPGAEMGLALALLRVIVASQQLTSRNEAGSWLKEICPVALKMIEDALDSCSKCSASNR